MLRRIRVGEDAFTGGNAIANLNRRLRRHKSSQSKRVSEGRQRKSKPGPRSVTDIEIVEVTTPSSYGLISNTPSSIGVDSFDSEGSNSITTSSNLASTNSGDPSESLPRASHHPLEGDAGEIRINDTTIPRTSNHSWDHSVILQHVGSSGSVSPQLYPSPEAINLNLFLRCIRDFAERSLQTRPVPAAEASQLMDPTSSLFTPKKFWQTLKNCIYLYKLNDLRHANPLLSLLLSLRPHTFFIPPTLDFLQQLLASFSPVNFRRHPPVRLQLLSHLRILLNTALGPQHLLTTICQQLLLDDDTRHATETALSCLHSSLVLAHDPLAFQTERAIIALLRRDGCLDDAARKARTLLSVTGAAPDPGYAKSREAAQELAHVYIDTGQFDEAKKLCMMCVGRAVSWDGGMIGTFYPINFAV